MASSRPHAIPYVITAIKNIKPDSILDIGVGFGKYGVLFREYTDIVNSESSPKRYNKENWEVRIEGIEGNGKYITPVHDFVYDKIHIGNPIELITSLGNFDLIFVGGVIEHFTHDEGTYLIRESLARSNKALILTTPLVEVEQPGMCDNALEEHKSFWTEADFESIADCQVSCLVGDVILAIYLRGDMNGR
jgi:hypothetical protein